MIAAPLMSRNPRREKGRRRLIEFRVLCKISCFGFSGPPISFSISCIIALPFHFPALTLSEIVAGISRLVNIRESRDIKRFIAKPGGARLRAATGIVHLLEGKNGRGLELCGSGFYHDYYFHAAFEGKARFSVAKLTFGW